MTTHLEGRRRGAKIVATLGPASSDAETIHAMVRAGMDVARLNFSHGDHATLRTLTTHIRAAERDLGRAVAILGDLQGPKIRIGRLDAPLDLAAGQELTIAFDARPSNATTVSCDYPGLVDDIGLDNTIYLKDGAIELSVTEVTPSTIETVVRTSGRLTSRAGVNVPGIDLRLPALPKKDLADLRFAVEQDFDYLALSFVRHAEDIANARRELAAVNNSMMLIAKIENALALDNLDAIVAAADGVMVARGDLGVEVGPESVPIWQRRIIRVAADHLVPVIVATQMLESMVESSRPTRAEASDVANAVWDGAGALMLSAESAVATDPVRTVAMMARIIDRAEEDEGSRHISTFETDWSQDPSRSISWAIRSIVEHNANIKGVVAFTISGYTARLIAKDRIRVPVLVLAPNRSVERRAALLWGVQPVPCPPPENLESMLRAVDDVARDQIGCRDGDLVVLAGGIPLGEGKPTNFLKLHRVGELGSENHD